MQSPEFPELTFVEPKSWTKGRPAGQPTVVVIHDTEGSEGKRSAENGASYDTRRTDGTSTHFFVDADSIVQCVLTKDTAHHARRTGNKIGIGFELCGRASQTNAQWHDGGLDLRLAARYVARCCKKYGIPVRRLTVSQLRAGQKGICGHVDITKAFPEDHGTHTDPGPNFPWSEFLGMVSAEVNQEGNEMFCSYGAKGPVVEVLQYRLNSLGYNIGTVDGDYGAKTASALARAVKDWSGRVEDGKTYGPRQMIYLDALWSRKYGGSGQPGPAGPPGPPGPPGPTGEVDYEQLTLSILSHIK